MKAIRFIAPAEDEMMNAAFYYQRQAKGLGLDFIDKVELAAKDLEQNFESWPVIKYGIRRRLVHRFPYALLYRNDVNEVVIIAVMHLHRRPDYWIDRLEG